MESSNFHWKDMLENKFAKVCSSEQERILDRWRDSITPPIRIIGSQYDRKRKLAHEDTEQNLMQKDRSSSPVREEHMKRARLEDKYIIPWCKELIEKINSASAKKVKSESKATGEELPLPRLSKSLIPTAMKDYLYAKVKVDQEDRFHQGALARFNAILASSASNAFGHMTAENSLSPFVNYHDDIRAHEYYAAPRYLTEDKICSVPVYHEMDTDDIRKRRSNVGSPRVMDHCEAKRRPKYVPSGSPIHTKVEEPDDVFIGATNREYCRICFDAGHTPGLSPVSHSRHSLTPPLLRVPAQRVPRADADLAQRHQFHSGSRHSDLHKSERSAFSLPNSGVDRNLTEPSVRDVKQGAQLSQERVHFDHYPLEDHRIMRSVQQYPLFYSRSDDEYVARSPNDIRRHYELVSRGTDRIYDDLSFETYKVLAPREHRLYSSPDSQRSEDSGFSSTTKEAACKGKVTVETQTVIRKGKGKSNDCFHLWEFLRDLLNNETMIPKCMEWTNREIGEFRLIKTGLVAKMWGQSKNRTSMTYEKMARAMRYYYKIKILEKVPNKRLHFRFGKHMLPKVLVDYKPSPPMPQRM